MTLFKSMIMMTLVAAIFFIQPAYADALPANVAGKVVWVNGDFKAVSPDKQERVLKKDSPIYVSDTLLTSDHSQAQIVFTDHTLMTFRDNTKFYIEKYSFDSASTSQSVGTYVMQLIEGGFRTITGKIAKVNSKDYMVKTSTATMGVRGTDYAAYVHGGKSYMMFYNGTPFMQNAQGIVILNRETPYVLVPGQNQAPVILPKQPVEFKETLKVVPAVITPAGTVSTDPVEVKKVAGGVGGGAGAGADCDGPAQGFNLKLK